MVRLELRMTDSNAILFNFSPLGPSLLRGRQIALNATDINRVCLTAHLITRLFNSWNRS